MSTTCAHSLCPVPLKSLQRSSCRHHRQQQQQQCSVHCNYTDSTHVCSSLILTNVSKSIIFIVINGVFQTLRWIVCVATCGSLVLSLVSVVIIFFSRRQSYKLNLLTKIYERNKLDHGICWRSCRINTVISKVINKNNFSGETQQKVVKYIIIHVFIWLIADYWRC